MGELKVCDKSSLLPTDLHIKKEGVSKVDLMEDKLSV